MDNIEFTATVKAHEIEPRFRHQKIFEVYDELASGQFMELSNDHDPKPLHYQMMIEKGEDAFTWEYLEQGPSLWKVSIGKK